MNLIVFFYNCREINHFSLNGSFLYQLNSVFLVFLSSIGRYIFQKIQKQQPKLFCIIFQFVNSNENNLIYFPLTNGKEEQINFVSELLIRASCSRLRSFVHHVVGDVKLDAQEKLCANDIQRVFRVMQRQHNVVHETYG